MARCIGKTIKIVMKCLKLPFFMKTRSPLKCLRECYAYSYLYVGVRGMAKKKRKIKF